MTHTILSTITVIFGLTACMHSNHPETAENPIAAIDTISTTTSTQSDSIIYDDFIFPVDSIFTAKVLTVGTFHKDEVSKNASRFKWYGLFKSQNGYYLKQTKIKTTNVYDPVLDEDEDEKTGWEIQAINEDTCLILIEPLSFLTDRIVQDAKLPEHYIYPGDTIVWSYSGINYTIFATGKKKKVQEDPDWFDVWNYKLYLTATINGQQRKSLLVAQPGFDDQMIYLIFAGDIDGDGILDLIIDTSAHYNATIPTIYLSKPAQAGELVKPVGGHRSVGC